MLASAIKLVSCCWIFECDADILLHIFCTDLVLCDSLSKVSIRSALNWQKEDCIQGKLGSVCATSSTKTGLMVHCNACVSIMAIGSGKRVYQVRIITCKTKVIYESSNMANQKLWLWIWKEGIILLFNWL